MPNSPQSSDGSSGLDFVDHAGFSVASLDRASSFFCDVFGAQELFRYTREQRADRFMSRTFDVHDSATFTLAMLRLSPNINLELFEWKTPNKTNHTPHLSDLGASHLAFHVADIETATARMVASGMVTQLGTIKTVPEGSLLAGNRWCYFQTDFGMSLELLTRTTAQPYEMTTQHRLYAPDQETQP